MYDGAIIQRARSDDTARQLMPAPGVGRVVALAYITGVWCAWFWFAPDFDTGASPPQMREEELFGNGRPALKIVW
jgi:hypothetical protein